MNVGQAAHLSGQMSGQAAQMNQVGGSRVGGAGADGMPQHQQMQDVVGLGGGIDPQFVMLRNNMREKIFEYIGRKQSSADWRRRLPELARRLEEILFRKFPNKIEYYNMMKAPVEPQLQFAIKTLSAQNQQNQQNQQMSRQIASSSGYGTMIPTPGITQGASGNSRMSYVTDNTGLSSSGAGMISQNAVGIYSKVNDLEQQLRREKEECHRMTSKMKKFIKAHGPVLKAQEELKRSQARFERLGDLLASDILKRCANEEVSNVHVDEDPNAPYKRSPNATAARKRSIPYSTSDEAKAVKKRRERDSDTITRSDKYRSEGDVTDFDKTNKGTEATKSLYLKKRLREDEKNKLGNVVSSVDKVKDSPVKHVWPSTGMAAHALYDLNEAVELENRYEPVDASLENDADDRTRSPVMPPPPPVVQNAYEQYEDLDEEVDVE